VSGQASYLEFLVPYGDDGRQAALIPPRVCALLWAKFGTELERLRREPSGELPQVLYALHAAGLTHRAATAARISPGGTETASGAEPRRTSSVTGDPSSSGGDLHLRREFSTKQVAELLDVGDRRVRQLREQGQLHGRKVGRDWRYDAMGVEALAEQRR
jgi:excisionase family DNA binding protein